jgi:hypothetical protein
MTTKAITKRGLVDDRRLSTPVPLSLPDSTQVMDTFWRRFRDARDLRFAVLMEVLHSQGEDLR